MQLLFQVILIGFCITASQSADRKASLVVLPPLILGYDELYADVQGQGITKDTRAKQKPKDSKLKALRQSDKDLNRKEQKDSSREKMRDRLIENDNLSSHHNSNHFNENQHESVNSQDENFNVHKKLFEEKIRNHGIENENLSTNTQDRNSNGQKQSFGEELLSNENANIQGRNDNGHKQLYKEEIIKNNNDQNENQRPNIEKETYNDHKHLFEEIMRNRGIENENANANVQDSNYNTQNHSYGEESMRDHSNSLKTRINKDSVMETLLSLERYMPDIRRYSSNHRARND